MKFRIDHDLTQEQLGNTLGVSTGYINQIELGKQNPSYKLLIKFKEIFKNEDVMKVFEKKGGK